MATSCQYPKFEALLKKLTEHLYEDYSSKSLHNSYESSMSELNRERRNFLKVRLIQNIAEEYSTGLEGPAKIVRDSLATTKLTNIVSLNHRGKRLQLANISEGELKEFVKKDEVQKTLKPVIKSELLRYEKTVRDFCGQTENRSVSSIINSNCYNRSRSVKLEDEIISKQLEFVRKSGSALKLYNTVATHRTTPTQKAKHVSRVTSLAAMATRLNLLTAYLEGRILAETYTEKTVSALRAIHAELRSKQHTLDRELVTSQHKLEAYLALGQEFCGLVEQYSGSVAMLETYRFIIENVDNN